MGSEVSPAGALARVEHANQSETLRRGRRPSMPAIARGQDGAEPVGVASSPPDVDHAADDVTRHVVEVAIRRQEDDEPLLTAEHVERPDDAHRVLLAPGRGAERAEVVP